MDGSSTSSECTFEESEYLFPSITPLTPRDVQEYSDWASDGLRTLIGYHTDPENVEDQDSFPQALARVLLTYALGVQIQYIHICNQMLHREATADLRNYMRNLRRNVFSSITSTISAVSEMQNGGSFDQDFYNSFEDFSDSEGTPSEREDGKAFKTAPAVSANPHADESTRFPSANGGDGAEDATNSTGEKGSAFAVPLSSSRCDLGLAKTPSNSPSNSPSYSPVAAGPQAQPNPTPGSSLEVLQETQQRLKTQSSEIIEMNTALIISTLGLQAHCMTLRRRMRQILDFAEVSDACSILPVFIEKIREIVGALSEQARLMLCEMESNLAGVGHHESESSRTCWQEKRRRQ